MYIKDGVAYYGKDIDTLSVSQLVSEIEWMEGCIEDYIALGQGMSSKESVYYSQLKIRLAKVAPEVSERLYG